MADDLLPDEHPVARLVRHGADTLSDAELIAALTGCRLPKARDLVRDGLPAFAAHDWTTARSHRLCQTTSARIAAALELGRRLAAHPGRTSKPIVSPLDLVGPLMARYAHAIQEHLVVILLDSKHRVIGERELFVGTINFATVSTREVVKLALDAHATNIVLAHCHPSGDPAPSAEDREFTEDCLRACRLMRIEVLDHLIIGANSFCSMKPGFF